MLTKEQLKNLKKGDKVLAEVSFSRVWKDNDLICNAPFTSVTGDIICSGNPYHPSCLTLPPTPPKYDPTRLFKKGDRVRVVKWNGRDMVREGMEGCVVEDESRSKVELAIDGWPRGVFYLACHLELVIPAEEVEPYSVKETMSHDGWQIVRDGLPLAIYDSQRHPNAKAAAEEERDRLNAEYYRKNYEQ